MCLADRLPSAIGRGESKGRRARLPRVTFVTTSGLRDALSVRGDKTIAMHCRKKPRDALSVRNWSFDAGHEAVTKTFAKAVISVTILSLLATISSMLENNNKSERARCQKAVTK